MCAGGVVWTGGLAALIPFLRCRQAPPSRKFAVGAQAYAQYSEDNLWYLCRVLSHAPQTDSYFVEYDAAAAWRRGRTHLLVQGECDRLARRQQSVPALTARSV